MKSREVLTQIVKCAKERPLLRLAEIAALIYAGISLYDAVLTPPLPPTLQAVETARLDMPSSPQYSRRLRLITLTGPNIPSTLFEDIINLPRTSLQNGTDLEISDSLAIAPFPRTNTNIQVRGGVLVVSSCILGPTPASTSCVDTAPYYLGNPDERGSKLILRWNVPSRLFSGATFNDTQLTIQHELRPNPNP